METLCGAKCDDCGFRAGCKGCVSTCGSPFGGRCVAAEYIKLGGMDAFTAFKKTLMDEFNALAIPGMPEVTELYELNGSFVNLDYPLPGGGSAKFLNDSNVYLGSQLECLFNDDDTKMCFGLVAGLDFLLVCRYGENGLDPELVMFKKR